MEALTKPASFQPNLTGVFEFWTGSSLSTISQQTHIWVISFLASRQHHSNESELSYSCYLLKDGDWAALPMHWRLSMTDVPRATLRSNWGHCSLGVLMERGSRFSLHWLSRLRNSCRLDWLIKGYSGPGLSRRGGAIHAGPGSPRCIVVVASCRRLQNLCMENNLGAVLRFSSQLIPAVCEHLARERF